MEMIALTHLYAVKDVVTSIDHLLTIFVCEWTSCQSSSLCRCFKTKGGVKNVWTLPSPQLFWAFVLTSLPIDTTGMPSKSPREPLWWGSVLHYHRFLNRLMLVNHDIMRATLMGLQTLLLQVLESLTNSVVRVVALLLYCQRLFMNCDF